MRKLATNSNKIAVIVPEWLQPGITVLLNSLQEFEPIAFATILDDLLSLDLPGYPDLVLFDAPKDPRLAREQLKRLKTKWPQTHCLILESYAKDRAHLLAYGADEVLVRGASPQRLISAILNYRMSGI